MRIKNYIRVIIVLSFVFGISNSPPWGFYGHRKINRIAVFSLPPEMISFYKKHIEFITEHAVDPDKRRYAIPNEGVKHYIDIDHWGDNPFEEVPKKIVAAILKYADFAVEIDSIKVPASIVKRADSVFVSSDDKLIFSTKEFWFNEQCGELIGPDKFAKIWRIPLNYFVDGLPDGDLVIEDHFVEYGIVPYHLSTMQNRLEKAFYEKDVKRILRVSAEIGHYIGDASVPLHTTENYNGQLTNQVGIHAFWESRIVELFSDDEFDLFVGKATYIKDKTNYFWNIVKASHSHLDSVLSVEKRLSKTYPSDEQYCFDDRLGQTIKTQCQPYTHTYMEALDGMVQSRMRSSIQNTASTWYTAWIDAGSPDLSQLMDVEFTRDEIEAFNNIGVNKTGKDFKTRPHNEH